MKAIVKYASGEGNVEMRDVGDPSPRSHQVRVEVKAAGLCGSDIHIYRGDMKLPVKPPVVMGHEFAGVVVELGDGAEGIRVGDRVTCETAAYVCGECYQCRTGNYNICPDKRLIGYVYDGCFAKYCVVQDNRLHLLPENVDFEAGALSEPLACCVHAVLELTAIRAGDVVAITGPGTIGLLCLQLVKAAGCHAEVLGSRADTERLQLARALGADVVTYVDAEDPVDDAVARVRGEGVDVFLECSGAPAAARLGLELTRRGGQYTQVGLFGARFELDFALVAYKELKVTGSLGQKWSAWKRGLDLLAQGKVSTRPLISQIMPLSEWRHAFQLFESKTGLKIVFHPE